ncbi:hypothetical protein ABPG75_004508 [Micractinium tetrahymenae]
MYFNVGQPATCYTYGALTGGFVNMTVPTLWDASGSIPPSDAEMTAATDQLCQGSSIGDAFVQAVAQGGSTAKAWIAAWFFSDCSGASDAAQAFITAVSAKGPNTALTYAQNWVDACDEMGFGSCVTVTSLSSAGSVLGEVQVHTDVPASGTPDSPPAPSAPPASGPPTPPGGSPSLPDGSTQLYVNVGLPASCVTYSTSAGGFVNMTVPTYWNASGSNLPSQQEVTLLIDQICQGGSSAADSLGQALYQGGDQARVWVIATILAQANCSAAEQLPQAFWGSIEAKDPNTVLVYAQSFVMACQELGIGACVTVTSLSSAGAVLGEVQLHTDVPVPSPTTARRRLHLHPHMLPT